MGEADIEINVLTEIDSHIVKVQAHSYRNIMSLLKDKIYTDGFGECGGMGRCGTCQIEILSEGLLIDSNDRNEEVTLKKLGITNPNIRLSCQMLLTKQLDGAVIKIVED